MVCVENPPDVGTPGSRGTPALDRFLVHGFALERLVFLPQNCTAGSTAARGRTYRELLKCKKYSLCPYRKLNRLSNNSSLYHRRSIRLKGYDYASEGGYFITIVTHEREGLFGGVINGEMNLNALGRIAWDEWFRTAALRPYVELFEDEFIVMPNHIHGIIWIASDVGAYCNTPLPKTGGFRSPAVGIGAIIRSYKSAVTKRINQLRDLPACQVWQRNYYEHVIGNDTEYENIVEYIDLNPRSWGSDAENPASSVG